MRAVRGHDLGVLGRFEFLMNLHVPEFKQTKVEFRFNANSERYRRRGLHLQPQRPAGSLCELSAGLRSINRKAITIPGGPEKIGLAEAAQCLKVVLTSVLHLCGEQSRVKYKPKINPLRHDHHLSRMFEIHRDLAVDIGLNLADAPILAVRVADQHSRFQYRVHHVQ